MKKLALLVAAVVLVSCSGAGPAEPQNNTRSLKIVQYNVGVFGKELDNAIPMISEMMKELNADVISLNELDSCNLRHSNYQIKDFAEAMGDWNFRYAHALPSYKGGSYGVGVCTKDEIISSYEIHFDKYDGSETRACCVVETADYVLASTHLDHKGDTAQLTQAKVLNEAMVAKYGNCGKPVFLCGDMNAYPNSNTVKELKKAWSQLSGTDITISPKNPRACIDYVFLLKNGAECKVSRYSVPSVFTNGDVTLASDHFPVFVEVEFDRN